MACDTMVPTATSLSPACAAFVRSTFTATYGSDALRLSDVCLIESSFFSEATIASVDFWRSSFVDAVMSISMSLDAPKPLDAETVMSPWSVIFDSSDSTVFCSAVWSAFGSVVTENVMLPPPPVKASRRELPDEPIDSCTVLIPLVSSSFCSTTFAAASCASRLVPGGRVCEIVSVFWPVEPRKFVFISGVRRIVPMRTTSARAIVVFEYLRVQRMIGR